MILALLGGTQCSKEHLNSDYMIFGHAYGFCRGEDCVELFKLESGQLYGDRADQYPGLDDVYDGHFIVLSEEKYNKAKDLIEKFPQQLFEEEEKRIGCPDCADQGGYYVEYGIGSQVGFWFIDTSQNSIPEYLRNFTQELANVLSEIID